MFTILPAIDLVSGQAVRLHQGQAGSEEVFGHPEQIAAEFACAGAKWLHLVDLDAAFGRGTNADLVERIVRDNPGLQVEVGGGIRDDSSLQRMLDAGAKRVNIGTAVIEDPKWCAHILSAYGEQVAIGLDIKDGCMAGHAWTTKGPDAWEVLARLDDQGAQRYVVTDVSKDGTLTGPNLDLLAEVRSRTKSHIVASGGISQLSDLRDLADPSRGLEGAIVGKALYAKRFTLEQALQTVEG